MYFHDKLTCFCSHLDIASTRGVGGRRGGRRGDGRHLVLEETLPISLILGEDLVLGGIGGLVLALIHGHQPPHGVDLPGLVLVFLSSSIDADDKCGEANDGGDAEPHGWRSFSGFVDERRNSNGIRQTALGPISRRERPSLALAVPNAQFKAMIVGCPMERLHVLCQGAGPSNENKRLWSVAKSKVPPGTPGTVFICPWCHRHPRRSRAGSHLYVL